MGNIFKCCGKTGKPSGRIVAYVDIILALLLVVGGIVAGAMFPDTLLPSAAGMSPKHANSSNIVSILLLFAGFFVECCLCNILLSAIKNKNPIQCDNWIKIRLILLCLLVFGLVYWMMGSRSLVAICIVGGIGLAYILYRVYSMMVVRAFQNELRRKVQELQVPLQKI